MRRFFLIVAGVVFFGQGACFGTVMAATRCVSTSAEMNGALFDAGNSDEEDEILVVQGNYVGTFVYSSTKSYKLAIKGGYNSDCSSRVLDPNNTVIDGNQSGPCLTLTSATAGGFEVEGLSFRNGKTTINPYGGGVRLATDGGNVVFQSNVVESCHADIGGGSGGGLYINNADEVLVRNNVLKSNTAASSGAGFYCQTSNQLEVEYNEISGNEAGSNGGGIYATGTRQNSYDSNVIKNNRASYGGGIHSTSYTSSANSYFTYITNNIIQANECDQVGGGIYLANADSFYLTGNYIAGNDSDLDGGGVYTKSGIKYVFVWNNLVSENRSGRNGHGAYIYRPVNLMFYNNTLARNCDISLNPDTTSGGGLYLELYLDSAQADIYNNIFWSNTADSGSDIYLNNDGNNNYGASTSNINFNDFDQSEEGFYTPEYFGIDPGNLDKEDPLFTDEANGNFRLEEFSPCIDEGFDLPDGPEIDIDGVPRPIGPACDMGAYESIYSCENQPVERNGSNYDKISACIKMVAENCEIHCHALKIEDDVDFDKDVLFDLRGGYTCDYSGNSIWGYVTTLHGSLTISKGTVTVENFVIE